MPTEFNSFVRLPPDSTGKRLHADITVVVGYENATDSFSVTDTIVGESSGLTGEITFVKIDTSTTGTIAVSLQFDAVVTQFVASENLKVGGVTIATAVDTGIPIYGQFLHISGANNILNGQFVDKYGAAYTRFEEGPQQLDSFGASRFTTPTSIGDYTFDYGKEPLDFDEQSIGNGQIVELIDESAIRLEVDSVDGDYAAYSSRKYHIYQAGYSQLIEMTVASGDNGKSGVTRRWGYFTDTDGLFFQLSGSIISVVIRSSAEGTGVTENVVAQDSWNGDKVDGSTGLTNLSDITLSPERLNLYWIDFQWLGGGQVRFGVYVGGRRILLHRFSEANLNLGPYMRTATLPVRCEIENFANTPSPSTLKLVCAAVKTEGLVIPDFQKKTRKSSFLAPSKTVSDETYLATFKSADLFNGLDNRKASIPEVFHVFSNNDPIIIRLYQDSTLVGDNFVQVDGSAVSVDTVGSFSGGDQIFVFLIDNSRSLNLTAPANFGTFGEQLRKNAFGNEGNTYTFTAESLVATTGTDVVFGMTWVDVG